VTVTDAKSRSGFAEMLCQNGDTLGDTDGFNPLPRPQATAEHGYKSFTDNTLRLLDTGGELPGMLQIS
jgi:hypothetical protein